MLGFAAGRAGAPLGRSPRTPSLSQSAGWKRGARPGGSSPYCLAGPARVAWLVTRWGREHERTAACDDRFARRARETGRGGLHRSDLGRAFGASPPRGLRRTPHCRAAPLPGGTSPRASGGGRADADERRSAGSGRARSGGHPPGAAAAGGSSPRPGPGTLPTLAPEPLSRPDPHARRLEATGGTGADRAAGGALESRRGAP